jgi:hypothetical protein
VANEAVLKNVHKKEKKEKNPPVMKNVKKERKKIPIEKII